MKASALILRLVGGQLVAIPNDRTSELVRLAEEIKAKRKHEGKAVESGMILAHDRPFPVNSFRIQPETKKPK